eukprot:4086230-Karenia_brevis.AAC.1
MCFSQNQQQQRILRVGGIRHAAGCNKLGPSRGTTSQRVACALLYAPLTAVLHVAKTSGLLIIININI